MKNKRQFVFIRGFTLLELAVSLLIIAFIIGTVVMSEDQRSRLKQKDQRADTVKVLEAALLAYRVANNALPCPGALELAFTDANFGKAADTATLGRCDLGATYASTINNTANDVFCGSVPVVTLAIDKKYALDERNRKITYCVTGEATNPCYWTGSSGSLGVPDNGHFVIQDESGTTITTKAVSAFIFHGENGHGAYNVAGTRINAQVTNAAELKNCMCTSAAVSNPEAVRTLRTQRPLLETSTDATTGFDDGVYYQLLGSYLLTGEIGLTN
jgi:type II secretory pathway pseudopilin PulG